MYEHSRNTRALEWDAGRAAQNSEREEVLHSYSLPIRSL